MGAEGKGELSEVICASVGNHRVVEERGFGCGRGRRKGGGKVPLHFTLRGNGRRVSRENGETVVGGWWMGGERGQC